MSCKLHWRAFMMGVYNPWALDGMIEEMALKVQKELHEYRATLEQAAYAALAREEESLAE